MFMSKELSGFYLSRTMPFINPTELSRRLRVSRPTIERWDHTGLIPVKAQAAFDDVLSDLANRFRKEARRYPSPNFYEKLESAMMDTEPNMRLHEQGSTNREDFIDELRDLLKKPTSSRKVMRLAEQYSISVQLTHKIARDLGIIKDVEGVGRAMRSTWSLPGRSRG